VEKDQELPGNVVFLFAIPAILALCHLSQMPADCNGLLLYAILCSINDLLHLSHILDRRRQILITRFRNQNIVLNPNTSDTPVPVQHIKVDVLRVHRILQVRLNNEAAKVDLDASVSGSFRYKKTDSLQARQ
jgi:hypothetical protein